MIVAICGKSASGKDDICNRLVDMGLHKIVTVTTRPKREDEIEGRDYRFVYNQVFSALTIEGKLAEWTKYNGYMYGSLLQDYNIGTENAVVVLTPEGIQHIKERTACEMCSFYIKTDYQIRKRKMIDSGMTDKEISSRRTQERKRHFKNFNVDYVIDYNNQNLEEAVSLILRHAKITI